jgi:hypothetical protein
MRNISCCKFIIMGLIMPQVPTLRVADALDAVVAAAGLQDLVGSGR